jgi:hypothetical protein
MYIKTCALFLLIFPFTPYKQSIIIQLNKKVQNRDATIVTKETHNIPEGDLAHKG